MDDYEIARRVRNEHERVNAILAEMEDALGGACASRDADWLDHVRERFERLRAHLHQHIALKERDGFLVPVLEHRPTLSPEVDRLRDAHREQLSLANDIFLELQGASLDARLRLDDCELRIRHLISEIRHHAEMEALLVTSAFCRDLGGET